MSTRNILEPLPQIGKEPIQLDRVADALNELGADGYALKNVYASGNNNGHAFAGMVATINMWEYRLCHFQFKNPLPCQKAMEALGAEGWELVCVYGQGGGNNTIAVAVFKRPNGTLLETIQTGAETENEPVTV